MPPEDTCVQHIPFTVIEGGNPNDNYRDLVRKGEAPSLLGLVASPAPDLLPKEEQVSRPAPLQCADSLLEFMVRFHYALERYYTSRPEPNEPEMVLGKQRW